MISLELKRPLAVIDIETTGLNKQEDRIVDICIIKIHPDGNQETLKSLINPTILVPIESTKIHGIKYEDVKDKPTFKEFAKDIINFIKDCDLCGFEIKFDLDFLESEFKRVGYDYSKDDRVILDIKQIYFKLEPRDLSSAYSKYCGKELRENHKAENDVKATIEVLEAQLKQHSELPHDINALQKFCSPRDPSYIDEEGKFIWYNGKATLNFGTHQGKTLEFLSNNERDYLKWITTANFSSEVKLIVNEAIEGKFPEPNLNEND